MDARFKISFCTVVKNRLHHLKETLPKNITDNSDCDALQFVVLDYNSTDGLEQWMQENMRGHISSGKLIYYRTNEPQYFKRSHSRNMAFTLADGKFICNLDADNFAGKGFASFLITSFEHDENIFLSARGNTKQPDLLGRICCRKSDFFSIGGYDEAMEGYGFEDFDLINRLNLFGLKKVVIDEMYLDAIAHSDKERISGEKNLNTLSRFYISHINPSKSEVLLLFKDSTYHMAKVIDCKTVHASNYAFAFTPPDYDYEYTLQEKNWKAGTWIENDAALILSKSKTQKSNYQKSDQGTLKQNSRTYFTINDEEMVDNIIFFHSQFINRNKMRENISNNRVRLSDQQPGKGIVFKNFDYSRPIVT